jgi:hypothetical protein
MPNPYDWDVITGADPSGQARMLADMLRRKQAVGELTGLVGGKSFSPWGENLARSAGGELSQLARLAEVRQEQARRQAADAEERRQWEAEMALKRSEYGQRQRALDAERANKASTASTKATEDLRKEFQNLQTYKNTQTIAESYGKIRGTSETGPGDVSLIYSYMRMVDPGSTVREGEFATAANAGGIPDRIVGWYNRALRGEKLPPDIRVQFKAEAKKLLEAQASRYEESAKPYRRLAEQAGVNPSDVILDLGLQGLLGADQSPATPAAPTGSIGPRRVSSEAEYNTLPPGTRYVAPDGSVRTKRGP